MNIRVQEIFGYSKEELLEYDSMNLYIFCPFLQDLSVDVMLSDNFQKEIPPTKVFKKNGTHIWGQIVIKKGVISGEKKLIVSIQDVTAIQESRGKLMQLSRVVEESPVSIVITDLLGDIEYVNPCFEKNTGYMKEEVLGKNPRILKSGEMSEDAYKVMWDAVSGGGEWQGEFHNVRKDGSMYWESATIFSFKDEFGEMTHYIALKEDITEQRETELALKSNMAEMENLNERLKDNQNQLVQSEKMASIGQLAAGVAHEINNPIGFIMSNLGTLKDYIVFYKQLTELYEALEKSVRNKDSHKLAELLISIPDIKEDADFDFISEDVSNLLQESADGIDRVKEIVQSLKSFARIDNESKELSDINGGIEATLKVVWNEIKYKCEVEKELNPIPQIMCNLGQLNQVFMNLFVNASHAIDKHGVLKIRTHEEDGNIIIEDSDNGAGIDEKHISKLFDPFFTTKPVGVGTGLGLSISHGIIEKHGGTISVKSELGVGTMFTITLPVVEHE